MDNPKNSILCEVVLWFKSREVLADPNKKGYYQKFIEEVFENKRREFCFKSKEFCIESKEFNVTSSKIILYQNIKCNNNLIMDKKEQNLIEYVNTNNQSISEKLVKNETSHVFLDDITEFLETASFFIKYISNQKIDSKIGKTKSIEISRTGKNIAKVLKSMGYTEKESLHNIKEDEDTEKGFYYQYKYFPIFCKYTYRRGCGEYRFLELKGYYDDESKVKINEILINIKNKIKDLFEEIDEDNFNK